ncbi:MAG: type II CRISPR-associated endonuclease Cas1 [Burkholderiales bacterium]|nr:type II CRISPR-associated endonuclease Cas1 [Burkholderiales bacterium]
MIGRIVEIAEDCRHVSVSRGFVVVRETEGERKELARIPIDDVAAVIANGHGLTYTNNLVVALAQRGAPLAVCGPNHNVVGMLVPVEGHHVQAKRFDAQIGARKPLLKRAWTQIVRAKLSQQAAVLEAVGAPSVPLTALAKRVRSGDPDNLEAQAARRYWALLFGEEFRRDPREPGANGLLNYGYTILRTCMARSVVAAGLHPTVGLHHANQGNSMRLVDDLIEPFRPLVDFKVWKLLRLGEKEVTASSKRALARTLFEDLPTPIGLSPVFLCVQRLAASLAQVFLGERKTLELPLPGLPAALAAKGEAE